MGETLIVRPSGHPGIFRRPLPPVAVLATVAVAGCGTLLAIGASLVSAAFLVQGPPLTVQRIERAGHVPLRAWPFFVFAAPHSLGDGLV